jgi:heme-degrading monooxygenase HmoA
LPVVIQLVRFTSRLTYDEVMERFEARSDQYRQVPGLLQKYYVHYLETDEYGGVYVWDSEASLQAWRETNLSGTLASTYQVKDEPHREVLDVMVVLHADRPPSA